MNPWETLVIGVVGGFIGFVIPFRDRVFKDYKLELGDIRLKDILFGVIVSIIIVGAYTFCVLDPCATRSQAFWGGLTAEGFITSSIKKNNLKNKEK